MKVTVIGAGFGKYAVAPVFEKLGFEAEVVTPRDAAAVDRALKTKVDLISVQAPPFMQHDIVMRALANGQNVLCDKPFGKNVAEAEEMTAAAKKAGVLNFLNFEVRYKPNRAKIKELIDSGVIGKPLHMNWTFYSNGYRDGDFGWVNQKEMGGGWINGYASHCIDLMRWYFDSEIDTCGGISRIEYKNWTNKDGSKHVATAEDSYSAWFVMKNGCTAVQDTSYCAAVPMPMMITILGETGTIELVGDTKIIVRRAKEKSDLSAADRIRIGLLAHEGEVYEFPPAPGEAHEPALTPWFAQIKKSLETGQQISTSFEDGLRVSRTMDAFKKNMVMVG